VLRAEYEAIQGGVLPKTNFEAAHRNDVQEKKQTALCLSGGGIIAGDNPSNGSSSSSKSASRVKARAIDSILRSQATRPSADRECR
jgi:hypothetical protein